MGHCFGRVRANLEGLLRRGELLLETEDDVEVVDALGAEVALEGGGGHDIVLVDAKGIHEYITHVGFDISTALGHYGLQTAPSEGAQPLCRSHLPFMSVMHGATTGRPR